MRELEQILGDFEYLQKDTQAAVVEDVKLALGCQDRYLSRVPEKLQCRVFLRLLTTSTDTHSLSSCVEQQEALARLLKTAKIVLPQKRWAAVDRLSRATGIDMARAGRKAAGDALCQCHMQVCYGMLSLPCPDTANAVSRALCSLHHCSRLASPAASNMHTLSPHGDLTCLPLWPNANRLRIH